MPAIYSAKGSALRPYSLTKADYHGIGRLIRACAEIEDIINLFLCKLADIPEGASIVLLGKLPSSARLKMVEAFALAHGTELTRLYNESFNTDTFRTIIRCRNCVAHGWLLGLTDDGAIAFQIQDTQGVEEAKIMTVVRAWKPGQFGQIASRAEALIPQMERALGLQALREKRRTLALDPHTKSQSKGKQIAKRGRQPPPSPK